MRLIDADAFDERVRVAGGMSEEELTEDFKDGIQAVLYMLSKQPTINPEPQRMRGRWIEDGYNDEKAVCDQCGEPCATYIMGEPRDKYCKWCGAEMRGEQDEVD